VAVVILAAAAFFLFFRSPPPVGFARALQDRQVAGQQQLRRLEASTRLAWLQGVLASERPADEAESYYHLIRQEIESTFTGAAGKSKLWMTLEPKLDLLGTQIQEGSEETPKTIAEIVKSLGEGG
jgi:hypothetical protein